MKDRRIATQRRYGGRLGRFRRTTQHPLAIAVVLLCGCQSVPYPGVPVEPLPLELSKITAPAGTWDRQRQNPSSISIPDRLRNAHLLTQRGRPDQAIHILNDILYGRARPSPAIESYALFFRAKAYGRQGRSRRACQDCRRAVTIALDRSLRKEARSLLQHYEPAEVANKRSARDKLALLPRRAWSAIRGIPAKMQKMGRIFRLTIHHSANLARSPSKGEAARTIRLDQSFHMKQKGWGDIGYHYLIDAAGRIWTGRELRWQGAHAGNSQLNRGNVGVCLLGSFVRGSGGQRPTRAQLDSLQRLVRHLTQRYRIRVDGILTHREVLQGTRATECPGDLLQDQVDRMRRTMSRSRLATGPGRGLDSLSGGE